MFTVFMPFNKFLNMFRDNEFCFWNLCLPFCKGFIAHLGKLINIYNGNMRKVLNTLLDIIRNRKVEDQFIVLLLQVCQKNSWFSSIGSDKYDIGFGNMTLQFTYWCMFQTKLFCQFGRFFLSSINKSNIL